MAKHGRLTIAKFGPTMPVTAPAVQSPPFHYRDVEMMFISYETDEAQALAVLPDALELLEPATATVIFANYRFSTFGPYREAILTLACQWEGEAMSYVSNLFVTQEAPLIGGREIWGYPKKLAEVEFLQQSEQTMATVERPSGNRLATGVMRLVENVPAADFEMPPVASLKVIPDATDSGKPALAQLIRCDFQVRPVVGTDGVAEVWTGPGSLVYNAPTETDPWYRLSVKEVLACRYGRFHAVLPYGRILKTY